MTGQRTRTIEPAGEAHIELIAEGEGSLLVLLPSSSRDLEDFDAIAAAFAASGLRAPRPNPAGRGPASGGWRASRCTILAADLAAVIEADGGGRAVVLGHAFGQWVARTLAADRPDLVRGVVLAAAAEDCATRGCARELGRCADTDLPDAVRLAALRVAFFAPGARSVGVAGRVAQGRGSGAAGGQQGDRRRNGGPRFGASAGCAGRAGSVAATRHVEPDARRLGVGSGDGGGHPDVEPRAGSGTTDRLVAVVLDWMPSGLPAGSAGFPWNDAHHEASKRDQARRLPRSRTASPATNWFG